MPKILKVLPGVLLLFFVAEGALALDEGNPRAELRLWHQWTAGKRQALHSLVEDFNCENDHINVLAEPLGPLSGAIADRLLLDRAAGKPHLALVEREAVPMLADAGAIRPLGGLMRASALGQNLIESAIRCGTYNGKLYGIPARLNPNVLIYNAELLAGAGIASPPVEWVKLFELARAFGRGSSDDERWVLSVRSPASLFEILCIQKGIDPFEEPPRPELREKLREALDLVHEMRQTPGLLSPHYKFWDPKFKDITSGKVLFQIDNAAMLAHLLEKSSQRLRVTAPPSVSDRPLTSLSASHLFVIPAGSGRDRETLEFLEYFFSPEGYSRFAGKLLFVSPLGNAGPKGAASEETLYSNLVSAAENARCFTLSRSGGETMPVIARIVEQLDAGLLSPAHALEDILESLGEGVEAQPVKRPTLRVTWAESTRRLFRDEENDFRRAPVVLVSGRGEHECFQLAFSSVERLEALRVRVGTFVSGEQAARAVDTKVYHQTDTHIAVPLLAREARAYPNILQEREMFDVEPGRLHRVWVDVYVPHSVAPGEYGSHIAVERQGEVIAQIPIHLRVLPLAVPLEPSQPAVIGLDYRLIAAHYGLESGSEEHLELMNSYYWFMVEHRLSPYQPPVALDSPEIAAYLRDERVSGCRIPFGPFDARFDSVIELAEKGGWLEKMFVYFIDEPTYHQYNAIIDTGSKIHALSPSPAFLVTCFPDTPLIGSVDIWCIHMRFLPEGLPHRFTDRSRYLAKVNERLRAGERVWWYTAGAIGPFPTLHIEDDPAAFRIMPWLQQFQGIGGFLHWEAANWSQPLDEPFVPFFGNGEGVLVYPGEPEPSPSIRLELLREGLEDMEHLTLLQNEIRAVQERLDAESLGDVAGARMREICRRLVAEEALRAFSSEGGLLVPYFVRGPGNVERARAQVLEETLSTLARPWALVLTDPAEKQYTDSEHGRVYGVAEPGTEVRVNARQLAVDNGGAFSVQVPLESGTNSFSIRLVKGAYSKVIQREIEKF